MVLTQCDFPCTAQNVKAARNSKQTRVNDRGNHDSVIFVQCSECQSGEANDWRNREHVVLDLFSTLKMEKIVWQLWLTSRASDNYVDQLSRKLAMRHEPDIGLRCCSTCSKITGFSDEKHEGDDNPLHSPMHPVCTLTHHTTPHHKNSTTTPHGDREERRQRHLLNSSISWQSFA